MKNYLIEGLSGVGKSTVGRELAQRGYKVIEADFEPGVSGWIDTKTGRAVAHKPPFTKDWLARHKWLWDEPTLNKILDAPGDEAQFLVGGSDNMGLFLDRFSKRFFMYVNSELMKRRLQKREPKRWLEESAELARMTEWNEHLLSNPPEGVVLLDGAQPVEQLADKIVEEIVNIV